MTVRDIYNYIQTIAPEYMAMEWDHVGLLCGRMDREVSKILVALDPFLSVCEEAKALGCELLVTHHPAIWKLDTVNDQSISGRALLYLIENRSFSCSIFSSLSDAKSSPSAPTSRKVPTIAS